MTEKWPWPGDTPTERARRIANSLLMLLPAEERPVWAARAHAIGETWLGETLVRWTADDVVIPAEAARLVHKTTADLRKWVQMGLLARKGDGYRVGDVLDASAEAQRRRRTRGNRVVAKREA
jgi:hypothetical protein